MCLALPTAYQVVFTSRSSGCFNEYSMLKGSKHVKAGPVAAFSSCSISCVSIQHLLHGSFSCLGLRMSTNQKEKHGVLGINPVYTCINQYYISLKEILSGVKSFSKSSPRSIATPGEQIFSHKSIAPNQPVLGPTPSGSVGDSGWFFVFL